MTLFMLKKKIPKEIKKTVKRYIEALEKDGLPVEKALIFGSYARGQNRHNSDIDVVVISPEFGKNRIKEGQYLFKKAWRIDSRIEPIPYHPRDYRENNLSPLLNEIKKSAIDVS